MDALIRGGWIDALGRGGWMDALSKVRVDGLVH